MTELTHGIFTVASKFYNSNKGPITKNIYIHNRTFCYCNNSFDVGSRCFLLMIALTDAIVEPNGSIVWYFILDKIWITQVVKKSKQTQEEEKEKRRIWQMARKS